MKRRIVGVQPATAAEDFDFAGVNPVRRVKPFGEEERERFVTPEELAAKLQNEGGKWMAAAKEAGLKGD